MKSVRLSNNNLFSKIEYSSLYLKVGSCTSVIFRITMQPNNTENNIKSNFSVCCVPPPPLIPTHPTPSSTLSPPSPHCFLHCYIATLLHCYIPHQIACYQWAPPPHHHIGTMHFTLSILYCIALVPFHPHHTGTNALDPTQTTQGILNTFPY